jgi:hypothetical protein
MMVYVNSFTEPLASRAKFHFYTRLLNKPSWANSLVDRALPSRAELARLRSNSIPTFGVRTWAWSTGPSPFLGQYSCLCLRLLVMATLGNISLTSWPKSRSEHAGAKCYVKKGQKRPKCISYNGDILTLIWYQTNHICDVAHKPRMFCFEESKMK